MFLLSAGFCHRKSVVIKKCLVLIDSLQYAQYVDEQVDDIHVQVDGGQDVLLRRQVLHHHLRVVDDEQAEDEGASDGDQQLKQGVLDKHANQAAHYQHA